MLNKFTLHFRNKYDNIKNIFIRKYYDLKQFGFSGALLIAGGKREALQRGEYFSESKNQILSEIHILTEDSITNTISNESEEFKKGFRKFGELYIGFLRDCERIKLNDKQPDAMEKAKEEVEKEMLKKIQDQHPTI